MKIISTVWAILSLTLMFIGFFPCLGWLNWFCVPFAVIGLIMSIAGLLSNINRSADKGLYAFSILGCLSAIILGVLRLHIGLGIF